MTMYVRSSLNPRELDKEYTGLEGEGDWTWVGCKTGKIFQLAVTTVYLQSGEDRQVDEYNQ